MVTISMVFGLVAGLARTALVALASVGAFAAFGRIASYLVATVELQLGVAVAMALLTGVVVHRVFAISEIRRLLAPSAGGERRL